MAEHFDYSDMEAMTKYLSDRQKFDAEWDSFRKKIPDTLLDKWQKIMDECRANGFMRPRVRNSEIIWDQVVVSKLKYQKADGCTLCPKTFKAGVCKGRMRLKQNGIMFVPCWAVNHG